MMRKKSVIAGVLILSLACDSPTGKIPNESGPHFTATLDGRPWVGAPATVSGTSAASGMFTFSGFDSTGTAPRDITVSLYNIDKPGIYPLGMRSSAIGGHVSVKDGSLVWSTPPSGAAGSIELTTVSENRLVGTFSISAGLGIGTGTHTISNARFDVPLTSSGSIIVPSYNGSTVTGTMGGTPWRAANIAGVVRLDDVLIIDVANFTHWGSIAVNEFAGPGTFAVGRTGTGRAQIKTQADDWGVNPDLMSGTIIVTTATSSRVTGSLDITVLPGPGSLSAGPLRFVATFSVGLRLPP